MKININSYTCIRVRAKGSGTVTGRISIAVKVIGPRSSLARALNCYPRIPNDVVLRRRGRNYGIFLRTKKHIIQLAKRGVDLRHICLCPFR